RVIYYISPQLWAWHASRAKAIKRDVDKLLVILPFEKAFFKGYGIDAEFVGHPLLDAIKDLPKKALPHASKPTIALLPGSRKQEVSRILPVMLETTRAFPNHQFIVAGASSLPEGYYQDYLKNFPSVALEKGNTYGILQRSVAALVKSGTSTLETALLDVPQVVCYAGNPISYQIAKRLVKVKYISLVNLIVDRPLVREFIQHDLTPENATAALQDILQPEKMAEIKAGYAELRHQLGDGGASERAARAILAPPVSK
ncbi:MAG: lipid-A-disaccharide synthase, partial [Saprospiraceae bacterium]|nr:lipid-A-disaccharide synthase [Saprospiraceae bacterium]